MQPSSEEVKKVNKEDSFSPPLSSSFLFLNDQNSFTIYENEDTNENENENDDNNNIDDSATVVVNQPSYETTTTEAATTASAVVVDCWDSVTQPFCNICQMAFRSKVFLDRHEKYSDLHIKNAKQLFHAVSADVDETQSSTTTTTTTTIQQQATVVEPVKKPVVLFPLRFEGERFKLLYTGSKLFWRTNETVELNIYLHVEARIIEVVSFDVTKLKETNRLYLHLDVMWEQVQFQLNSKNNEKSVVRKVETRVPTNNGDVATKNNNNNNNGKEQQQRRSFVVDGTSGSTKSQQPQQQQQVAHGQLSQQSTPNNSTAASSQSKNEQKHVPAASHSSNNNNNNTSTNNNSATSNNDSSNVVENNNYTHIEHTNYNLLMSSIVTYVIQRLQLVRDHIAFAMLSSDHLNLSPIVEKVPDGVRPITVARRRRTTTEEINSAIKSLHVDTAALVDATVKAHNIASSNESIVA